MKSFTHAAVCLLLLSAAALSQTKSPAPPPTLKTRSENPDELVPNTPISPDTPVITIQGLCDRSAANSSVTAGCTTVITKADFEKIVNAIQPNMAPTQKKQLAARYATALVLANKAKEQGLDRSPEFDEQMQLARLQMLAQEAQKKMQKDAAEVSEDQISTYYQQHAADYRTVSFERIYVPRQKQIEAAGDKPTDVASTQSQRQASEAEMKAEADKLHERAAAGEDFTKLQQEAYDFAGSKMKATSVKMDNMRKTSIPATDAAIFDLKKGDVSQVFADPTGYRIYKLVEVNDLPLASVHDEIKRTLQGENMRNSFESLQKSTKTSLDEAYFATPGAPSLRNPGEAPAAQSAAPPAAPSKK